MLHAPPMRMFIGAAALCVALIGARMAASMTGTYYHWSGPAFHAAPGASRAFGSDPDADGRFNLEEYIFSGDPISFDRTPMSFAVTAGQVRLQFPVRRDAADARWRIEHAASVTGVWLEATGVTTQQIPEGSIWRTTASVPATQTHAFLRIRLETDAPAVIQDGLDDGTGWILVNNAAVVFAADGPPLTTGSDFLRHSVSGNWMHSAMYKPTGLTLREGTYWIIFNVGHDGTARPFAIGNVNAGFFNAATTVVSATTVRDAINALIGLPGVSRMYHQQAVPQGGWVTWAMTITIAPGSPAIGMPVHFGFHVQSVGTGQNQALFDQLRIQAPGSLPVFDDLIVVNATNVLRTNIPSTAFSGINVHHRSSVRDAYPTCSDGSIVMRSGALRDTVRAVGLRGLRYPGGTFAEETYDFFDPGGTNYLAAEGCAPGTNRLDTIEDVLAFCKEFNLEPYFTVPVKRFFAGQSGNTQHQFAAASNYAREAVAIVTNIERQIGAPRVRYWNIGNEVYPPEFSPAEYALFAGPVAQAIKAADPRARTVVSVQPQHVTRDYTDASNIVSVLKSQPGWWSSVDAFTMHILNAGMTNWGGDSIHDMTLAMRSLFENKEVLFTAISPTSWNGPWAANGFLSVYEQILRAGTDHVVAWPTAHHSTNGRFWHLPQGLTPSGLAIRWLREAAESNQMVATSHTDGNPVKVMAFRQGAEKLTVFVMGKTAGVRRVRINLQHFAAGHVRESRLLAYGGDPNHDFLRVETVGRSGGPFYIYDTVINRDSNHEVLRLEFTPVAPFMFRDGFEDAAMWTLHNNAEWVSASGSLTPLAGERMFRHNANAAWRHAAAARDWPLPIQPGDYVFTFQAGHDGTGIPFARDRVTAGFYEEGPLTTNATGIRDAITNWGGMTGVVRHVESFPYPSNAWATWRVSYRIDSNSPVVGRMVRIGLHAQSGSSGSQALLDDLIIEAPRPDAPVEAVIRANTPLAVVDPLMLGVNMVFSRQPLDAAYSNAFLATGMRVMRYPGGTVTEGEFDFQQPTDPHPSLSNAVAFCRNVGAELMLVVPTKRFVTNVAAGAQYASDFVRAVNIDKTFGEIFVRYWEIGNEYYASDESVPAITVDQYKVIADQFAAAMVAADPRITPIVQFQRSSDPTDLLTIAQYLASSTNAGSVRAILTHTYPGTNDFPNQAKTVIPGQLALGRSVFSNDLLFVTEWNIGSSAGQRGMRLANHLPALFDALLRGGARGAALWPLSWQFNGVGTALADVNTGVLRPPGQAMAWVSDSALDATLVHASFPHRTCSVSAYRRPDRLTVFISGRDLPIPTTMKLSIVDYPFSQVSAQRMTAANALSHNPATISNAGLRREGQNLFVDINASNAWELVRIVLVP